MCFYLFDCLPTITRGEDLVALKIEIARHQAQGLWIIIGDHDLCFLDRHSSCSFPVYRSLAATRGAKHASSLATGSRTCNALPLSGQLSAQIKPSWSLTIYL